MFHFITKNFSKNTKKTALIIAIFALPVITHAQYNVLSDTVDVDLIVEGCNNNLICEAIIGEDTLTCPLDCPVPAVVTPTPSAGGGDTGNRPGNRRVTDTTASQSGSSQLIIEQLEVTPGVVDVSFSFYTKSLTVASIRIGKTAAYEQTAVAEFGFRNTHSFKISGLQPETRYLYELFVVDAKGILQKQYGFFSTKSALSIPSIAQPLLDRTTDIKIIIDDGVSYASWNNPSQKDFEYVRVVRTTDAPTTNPTNGIVVYEGEANQFVDTGVVPNARYFYTFFSKYDSGLFSDGVPIEVGYNSDVDALQNLETYKPVFGNDTFSLFDFSFSQKGESLEWKGDMLSLIPSTDVTVRLRKDDLFNTLDDVYIDAYSYEPDGTITERRFQKFKFRTEIDSYETTLFGFNQYQTVLFKVKIFKDGGVFEYVLGQMKVGTYSFYESSSLIGGVSCKGYAVGLEHFKNVLWCTMPWPVILLFAFLTTVMYRIRVLLTKRG